MLRIFAPVIDAPNRLQLQASLDRWSFLQDNFDLDDDGDSTKTIPIFALDRDVLCKALTPINDDDLTMSELDQGRRRKLEELKQEDWELFAYITNGGSLVVRVLTVRTFRPHRLAY